MSNPIDGRRVKRFGTNAAAIIGLVFLTVGPDRLAFPQVLTRTEQTVGYVLQLEGLAPVRVRSVSGGELSTRTTTVTPLTFDWDLSPVLVPWVSRAIQARDPMPISIVLSSVDLRGSVIASKSFDRAVLTGANFPGVNAASNDVGQIALRVQSFGVKDARASAVNNLAPVPAPWIVSNFLVEIDDMPTKNVTAVEPFAWTSQSSVGNLQISMQLDSVAWEQWAEWVSSAPAAKVRNGHIRLLDKDLQGSFMTIDLTGLTPVRIVQSAFEANEAGLRAVTVELAVEALRLRN